MRRLSLYPADGVGAGDDGLVHALLYQRAVFHQAAYAFFLHRGYCRLCLLIQPAKGLRPPPDVKGGRMEL